jgi:ElaB/YqjD/DUF883 family membrane-anchored ribosome-binding protein
MRLTIDEYSKHFKMSKEMIHSKLKSKKLNYIIENGETYIILPQSKTDEEKIKQIKQQKSQKMQQNSKHKITVATVIELYKRENKALKEKIKLLEAKIDKLIDDKEQMLREERQRIENLYASKDEQLKNILELINAKLQMEQKALNQNQYEAIEATPKLVELKTYLKTLDLNPRERKIIKKRFQTIKGEDIRVQEQNGKIYLDFNKYDYSDLFNI